MIDPTTPMMQLGPVQTQWLANLRAYPERQMKNQLGAGDADHYTTCCLGELLLTKHRIDGTEPFFDVNGDLRAGPTEDDPHDVLNNYEELGLRAQAGVADLHLVRPDEDLDIFNNYDCLAELNDNGWTWPQIADLVERNPEAFFTHPV